MNYSKALSYLFPGIKITSPIEPGDVTLGKGGIIKWSRPEPQPTQKQLESAMDALNAQGVVRSNLLSAWESTFTVGEKALLTPVFNEVVRLFDAGNISAAKSVVSSIPSDISPTLATKRDVILSKFP